MSSTATSEAWRPDFNEIERLLPRLVLLPRGGPAPAHDKRLIEKCIRHCEMILASKTEIERADTLLAQARTSPRDGAGRSRRGLEGLFEDGQAEARAQGKPDTPGFRRLAALRMECARAFENNIPHDLQDWLEKWDKKVDLSAGKVQLDLLAEAERALAVQFRAWSEVLARARPGDLGWAAKLRAFWTARASRRTQQQLASRMAEIEVRARSLRAHQEQAQFLAGVLSAFMRLPWVPAGVNARSVHKLALLDLEQEAQVRLGKETHAARTAVQNARTTLSRRAHLFEQITARIASLEAQRSGLARAASQGRRVDAAHRLAEATAAALCEAFSEAEHAIESALVDLDAQRQRAARARREIARLMEVLDEHARDTQRIRPWDAPGSAPEQPSRVAAPSFPTPIAHRGFARPIK